MSFQKRIIELLTFDLHKELPTDVLIKLLLTNVFSFIIMIAATIFVFVSLNNGAIHLSYILLALITIHIVNFIIFFWKKNINLTKYIVVLSVELFFILLIFNGGKIGYGYLWFYGLPIISLFLIGGNKGRIITSSFLLFLIVLLFVPKQFISSEYNNSLLLRIIISYFTISAVINIIITINNNIINDLKNKLSRKNKLFEEKNKFFTQLSDESKKTFNNIISISHTNKNKQIFIQEEKFELLQNSTINLVNIINNIIELSEYKSDYINFNPISFNLLATIDNTINIFDNNNFKIRLIYSDKVPNILNGNPIRIKQILYNILNSITKTVNKNCKINIYVDLKSVNNNIINLRFKIELNQNILKRGKYETQNSNNIILNSVNRNIDHLGLSYTNNLIVESGGYLFIDSTDKNTNFKFSCSFTLTQNSNNNFSEIFLNNTTKKESKEYISDDIFKKMNILFVDDNILNKKIGEIELKNKFNKIKFIDNYKDALNIYTNNKFNIIIVNSTIRNTNCTSFVRKIKEYEYGISEGVKIIVINTNENKINKQELLSLGVIGFCNRNLNINKLLKTIREN